MKITLFEALVKLAPDSSKTTLRSWIKEGRINVDDIVQTDSSLIVEMGQKIVIGSKKRVIDGKIKILFEDEHLVVIDKPSGLLSVATASESEETVHSFLKMRYRTQKVFVVHRLDRDTSGVMLFALSEEAYNHLSKQFEKHTIERRYIGVIEGHLKTSSGTWQSYLYEDAQYVVHSSSNPSSGSLAITHYKVKSVSKKYSIVEFTLKTGKKNQIRVHCQEAGHPLAGDKKYGAISNPLKRLCLHAQLLSFVHPITGKQMSFQSPIQWGSDPDILTFSNSKTGRA